MYGDSGKGGDHYNDGNARSKSTPKKDAWA
jgi:hypothetical protein